MRLPRLAFALALVALLALALPAQAAGERTERYYGSGVDAGFVAFYATFKPTSGTPFGGAIFPPDGAAPTHVRVQDSTGRPVFFLVCQDIDLDYVCDAEEPQSWHCAREAKLEPIFSGTARTIVFVGTGLCGAVTTGTITLTTG